MERTRAVMIWALGFQLFGSTVLVGGLALAPGVAHFDGKSV